MAELSQNRGKRRDGEVLGGAVDFLLANARLVLGVGGAAVLGIATLAVKRLIDRATSSRDEDDVKGDATCLEDSWKELSLLKATPHLQPRPPPAALSQPTPLPAPSPSTPAGPAGADAPGAPRLSSPAPPCLTFQEKLLAFEQDHVTIPVAHVALAKQLAGDVALELQAYLRSKFPALPFGAVVPGGPLFDGLQAGAADPVRLLVPLALEPGLWSLVLGTDTVARDPRCWAVRRTQLEFRPRGSSPWDRFLVGGYLSSRVLLELLRKALTASVNWPAIGSLLGCLIRPRVASEELLLEVQHERLELTVAVLLAVTGAQAGDRLLLAWPLEGLAGNLWLQDLYPAEAARLRALDAGDTGTRRRLLLLLCGVCRGHSVLWRLGRSHLTQVVLRLGEEEADWAEEALGERFLQALELLIGSLEQASLPCHFNPCVNLLDGLREEEVEDLGYALYCGLQAPEGLLWGGVGHERW
ncbi:mitochondrial dynamics protein MID49 isoform X1 [Camelus ferus]|uniref:Mitochondrial dynamics protein MID49 n=6 Tax=Camelus TaxID=9836 RepID=S9XHY7_CAMFR|nr:mitochondrial dynamics protein MID49 isoform X1 [Camelus ferus]XP_032354880.1 mitochondrial dynamics protein MID49 isoform X1 [Camelus ferus]XP_032354881.1 mitochondrial dynamics protein MID49 isoform X1 [Camelus ferus]XP_032354882.1 mitochondrial dynamics protein MID49 isoform X1 [Camelus ferus]XP_032354883.1 mitochondrial dynamics protein MID49 isoform X1 [Camelus ferus]EPY87768.1 mitochondrial dynamic protein MID49 isoform 1 [Camelus ferus]